MISRREREVLRLSKKFTQLEIAKKLKISQPSVSDFYTNALKKIRDAKEVLEFARNLKYE